MISTRSLELVIDTVVVCLTLAKWETVSGQFGGYLTIGSQVVALLFAVVRHPRALREVRTTALVRLPPYFVTLPLQKLRFRYRNPEKSNPLLQVFWYKVLIRVPGGSGSGAERRN
jgi:hypothetical protein